MNLKPVFCYRLREGCVGALAFLGAMALIIVLTLLFVVNYDGTAHIGFSAIGSASCLYFFIWGIVGIREDLRMGLQFGVSRRTIFFANLLAALALSAAMALLGELLTVTVQALSTDLSSFAFHELYQMMILKTKAPLSASQHLASALFVLIGQVACYSGGMLLSVLYYRLSKLWIVIVSCLLGAGAVLLLPLLIWQAGPAVTEFTLWLFRDMGNWTLVILPLAAALLLGSFLLLRRAPLKTAK